MKNKRSLVFAIIAVMPVLLVIYVAVITFGSDPTGSTIAAPAVALPSTSSEPALNPDTLAIQENLAPSTPRDRVLRALSSAASQTGEMKIESDLRAWVASDGPGAARFAQGIAVAPLRERVMRMVAQMWGPHDAAGAVAWASALRLESERDAMLGATCLGLAVSAPDRAVKLARQLGLHDDGVLENLTQQWASLDCAAALNWVLQQPAGAGRDQLVQRVAFAETRNNPAAAADLVAEQMEPGSSQTEAVISVVNQWAQTSPRAAAAWIDTFAPGPIQERARNELRGITALN